MAASILPPRPPMPQPPQAGADAEQWTAYRNMKRMRETAEKFETSFMSSMLQHMWDGVKTDGPFGGGHAEETWRSILTEQYAKQITKRGGIGVADMVYRQMIKLQEGGK